MNSPIEPQNAKHKILNAAARVVATQGAAHLTIEGVATEADLSKGGVLYHYPNKRALLTGMLEFVLAQITNRADYQSAQIIDGENPSVRALIMAEQQQSEAERAMAFAILAAAAEDPSLVAPARSTIHEWFTKISAEGEFGILLLLANEGLRFMDMLQLLPEQFGREQLLTKLLEFGESTSA